MKGGGARARLDGLESHCKWGNRIAPTQWTKIEALLAGLTVWNCLINNPEIISQGMVLVSHRLWCIL